MNKKLLSYYSKELSFLKEMGQEFSEQYPKVAARLGLSATDIPDPYVERLLEGVSFLTARTQLKIDAEYPRFVRRILEVVYPQFLCPRPSATIATICTPHNYNMNVVNTLKRGQSFQSLPIDVKGGFANCTFTATQNLDISPLQLESVSYIDTVGYLNNMVISSQEKCSIGYSAFRMDFSISTSSYCSDLIPDTLKIFLGSDLSVSSPLLYLLMACCDKVICHSYENPHQWYYELESLPQHLGFKEDEALIFNLDKNLSSLRVMQEYIQLPEKFLFIGQSGVNKAIKKAEEDGFIPLIPKQIEEVIVDKGVNKRIVSYQKRWFSLSFIFNKRITELQDLVKTEDVYINAVPMVNLFRKKGFRFAVDMQQTEHHVVPDRTQPLNFEIHHIERVRGFDSQNNQRVTFTPIYQVNNNEVSCNTQANAFFSMRREDRIPSVQMKREGGRSSYLGSEVFLSLVDQKTWLFDSNIQQLSVDAWCTNRDLPTLMPRSAQSDFLIDSSLPIESIKLIVKVVRPKEAVNEDDSLWSLLNLLNFNYLSLAKTSQQNTTEYLKSLLLSFPHNESDLIRQHINAIVNVQVKSKSKVVRYKGNGGVVRGINIHLTIDDALMGGVHPYLFGSVLQHYFVQSISMNSFIQLSLQTLQQNDIIKWDAMIGNKAIL